MAATKRKRRGKKRPRVRTRPVIRAEPPPLPPVDLRAKARQLRYLARRAERAAGGEYDLHRVAMAQQSRERSLEGREIGPLPAVQDPARREACKFSHERFALTYFPRRFFWPFAPYHRDRNARMERCTHEGGLFAFAEPRGSGKTNSAEVEVLQHPLRPSRYVLIQAAGAVWQITGKDQARTGVQ